MTTEPIMTSTRPQLDPVNAGTVDVNVDVEILTLGQLAAGLRTCARGVYGPDVAVGLLYTHVTWLHRGDFRTHAPRSTPAVPECVWIDCEAAAGHADRSPAGASDFAMLRIALTHADHDTGDSLNAFTHAAGGHPAGLTAVVNGHVDAKWTSGRSHV